MLTDTHDIEKIVEIHGEKPTEVYIQKLSETSKKALDILWYDLETLTHKQVLDLLSVQSRLSIQSEDILVQGKWKHGKKINRNKFLRNA